MAATISLQGKVAVVTGGGRGIGKAIARRLAEAGASVVIASRKRENLEATAAELADLPGRVVPIPCHVGRKDELEALVRATEDQVGPVDVLVNNSATNLGQGPALDVTDEMLDKIVEINVKSALRLIRLIVPGMIERGGGSIINVASISGLEPQPGGLLYSFTKAGLIMLTRSWAREFGPHGVRVNAIAPGLVQTDFSAFLWDDPGRRAAILGQQAIPRLGLPDEIGYLALFLALVGGLVHHRPGLRRRRRRHGVRGSWVGRADPLAVRDVAMDAATSEGQPMNWSPPTLADVLRARAAISPYLRPSPTLRRPALDEALGCRAHLKCENLNPTGAFKVRGGINLLSTLDDAQRARGVLSASTGNHAQSVAYAAWLFGIRAVIYMPEGANPLKVAATRAFGAEVVLVGRDFDEARRAAEARAEREGMRYVHSADEPLLIAGVATCALELFEVAPDLDVLFVPVGGGSGVLGAAVVARAVSPRTRVIGVQAEGAPAVYLSWKAGRRVVTDEVTTFAEGLATREPFDLPLQLLPVLVDEIMLVTDDELEASIRLLIETTGQVAEGAGAASVAGAFRRRTELAGKSVGLILSGGNLPIGTLKRILDRHSAAG